MKIISRAEWGARQPSGGRNSINARPLGTAVHWNGPGCAASIRTHDKCAGFVRGIQNFHMDGRGWSDIAYTDFACPHGYLFEGRGKGVGTAANGTTHGNANYYATYAMWGQGDGPVPEAMLDTIAGAVALHRTWGAGDEVTKHRALFGTECPGDELSRLVDSGRFDKAAAPKPGGAQSMPKPQRPSSKPKPATASKSQLTVDGLLGPATYKALQKAIGANVDGVWGPQTRRMLQRHLKVAQDGIVGRSTIAALQRKVGSPADGVWGKATTKALQRALNKGTF